MTRVLGLLGGMAWPSTAEADRLLNTRIGAARGGLLGTRFTMEEAGIRDRLAAHGLTVEVPVARTRAAVHGHIYDELVHGEAPPRA